jgi:hypothetical protein
MKKLQQLFLAILIKMIFLIKKKIQNKGSNAQQENSIRNAIGTFLLIIYTLYCYCLCILPTAAFIYENIRVHYFFCDKSTLLIGACPHIHIIYLLLQFFYTCLFIICVACEIECKESQMSFLCILNERTYKYMYICMSTSGKYSTLFILLKTTIICVGEWLALLSNWKLFPYSHFFLQSIANNKNLKEIIWIFHVAKYRWEKNK